MFVAVGTGVLVAVGVAVGTGLFVAVGMGRVAVAVGIEGATLHNQVSAFAMKPSPPISSNCHR